MNNWYICWFYMHPLNAELNPICHLLALLGGATIVVVSRLRVKKLHFNNIHSKPFMYAVSVKFCNIQLESHQPGVTYWHASQPYCHHLPTQRDAAVNILNTVGCYQVYSGDKCSQQN